MTPLWKSWLKQKDATNTKQAREKLPRKEHCPTCGQVDPVASGQQKEEGQSHGEQSSAARDTTVKHPRNRGLDYDKDGRPWLKETDPDWHSWKRELYNDIGDPRDYSKEYYPGQMSDSDDKGAMKKSFFEFMKTSDHSGGPTGDGSYHEDDKEVSAEHSTHHTPHHEYKPTFIPTSYDKEEYVEWLDDRIGSKEGLESLQDPSLSESQIKRNPKNTKDNKESKKSFFEFMKASPTGTGADEPGNKPSQRKLDAEKEMYGVPDASLAQHTREGQAEESIYGFHEDKVEQEELTSGGEKTGNEDMIESYPDKKGPKQSIGKSFFEFMSKDSKCERCGKKYDKHTSHGIEGECTDCFLDEKNPKGLDLRQEIAEAEEERKQGKGYGVNE